MATIAQQQAMFTGCGICGGSLCPHEICRTCSACDECDHHEGTGKPPAKASPNDRKEQLRLHELAEERRQAMAELKGTQCPTCQRRKREMQSLCKTCFGSLPADVRRGLYLSFSAGYLPYYRKAKELLCA